MKHITILAIALFFISNLNAQNKKFETLFTEYSKHSISFESPKLKEYSEKLAQIQYAICGRKLSGTKLENKLEALSKEYGRDVKYMSKNDQENFTKTFELINKGYENCIQQQNNKVLKTLLREKEKELKKVIKNVKLAIPCFFS